jgi:hypothetical protein
MMKSPRSKALVIALTLGILYGLFMRFVVDGPGVPLLTAMSVAFLFIGPFAIGAISVIDKDQSGTSAFFWPTIPIGFGLLITVLFKLEGMICVVMYLPLGIIFGGIGGLVGRRMKRSKHSKESLLVIMALPFAVGAVENRVATPTLIHEVRSEILVHAPASKIWDEVKSVRTISKNEMPSSWVHHMGFPRPLDAVIDREEVGGVRLARFEGDLVFNEKVSVWKPNEELAFGIDIDPDSVPPTTLDKHVTIGGPYFDVLNGSYVLVPKGTDTLVILKSHFRLSTHFNPYAAFWSTLVMDRIQNDILGVVKSRAEGSSSSKDTVAF